jgi:hypothetical protein
MFPTGDEVARPAVPAGLILAPILRRMVGLLLDQILVALPVVLVIFAVGFTPDDTVTMLATRLTGDARNWQAEGFQILDPARGQFVPKSHYSSVTPDWQACVVDSLIASDPGRHERDVMMAIAVLLSAGFVAAMFAFDEATDRHKATSAMLEKFGAAFIREFERPLIDERGPRSVLRTELALSPDRRSLEVRLAPIDGRRYPNLADHRTNVEYDVERVMRFLNDRRFTHGPLRARGSWVAIPFQMAGSARVASG